MIPHEQLDKACEQLSVKVKEAAEKYGFDFKVSDHSVETPNSAVTSYEHYIRYSYDLKKEGVKSKWKLSICSRKYKSQTGNFYTNIYVNCDVTVHVKVYSGSYRKHPSSFERRFSDNIKENEDINAQFDKIFTELVQQFNPSDAKPPKIYAKNGVPPPFTFKESDLNQFEAFRNPRDEAALKWRKPTLNIVVIDGALTIDEKGKVSNDVAKPGTDVWYDMTWDVESTDQYASKAIRVAYKDGLFYGISGGAKPVVNIDIAGVHFDKFTKFDQLLVEEAIRLYKEKL